MEVMAVRPEIAGTLAAVDPEVEAIIRAENRRQHNKIRLIPSENYASQAVLEATGSILTNKYSEGYAGARYYEGQREIDKIERLCVERAKEVFGAEHVNVQPYSGSPANQAVYVALCEPGDTVMGLSLAHGGHLTHGDRVSISGMHYKSVQYGGVPGHRPNRLRSSRSTGQRTPAQAALLRGARPIRASSTLRVLPRSGIRWGPSWSPTSRISLGWWPPGVHPSPVPARGRRNHYYS